MRRLLVVEVTFNIRGRGVIVAPFLDASEARREQFAVELRKPNGETVRVMAFAQIPFITPRPPTPQTHLTLLGVSKEEVPHRDRDLGAGSLAITSDKPVDNLVHGIAVTADVVGDPHALAAHFEIDGVRYRTAEHWMMAFKAPPLRRSGCALAHRVVAHAREAKAIASHRSRLR